MFGGSAKMFPRTPLWLSTGLAVGMGISMGISMGWVYGNCAEFSWVLCEFCENF